MTVWSTTLDQLLDEVAGMGLKFTGTATASGTTVTTTDPEIIKGTAGTSYRFQQKFLYVSSATGADEVHAIVSHVISGNTATITTLGTYGSTYTNAACYILAVPPSQLMALANDALDLEYTDFQAPLRSGPDDADMQDSATTSWPDTSNVTMAVQATAAEVLFGTRSKSATFSAAGYSQSTLVNVGTNKSILVWGIWKSDVGTNGFELVDSSGNSLASVTSTQEIWVMGKKELEVGVESVRIRLTGSAASDQGDWNAAVIVKTGDRLFKAPSWVDERFKAHPGLAASTFHTSATEADTWEAESMTLQLLEEGVHYRYITRKGDANPHQFEILDAGAQFLSNPMWIVGGRPYSDFGTISTYSGTTNCPIQVWKERIKVLIGERWPQAFPDLASMASAKLAQREALRQTAPPEEQVVVRRMFT